MFSGGQNSHGPCALEACSLVGETNTKYKSVSLYENINGLKCYEGKEQAIIIEFCGSRFLRDEEPARQRLRKT